MNRLINQKTFKRSVKGYQVGHLLQKLEQNLMPYPVEYHSSNLMMFTPVDNLNVSVREQVNSLFLGHITQTEFSVDGSLPNQLQDVTNGITQSKHVYHRIACQDEGAKQLICRFESTGFFKRQGIKTIYKGNPSYELQLVSLFTQFPEFYKVLNQLDFTSAQLEILENRWVFTIQHFAASEVIGRIPSIRRYIPLIPEQRQFLLSCLLMISQLMQLLDSS